MVNLSKNICFKFAEARRREGLSQSALAEEVGCMQSAISMFEKGNVTKLSKETIQKLSDRLKVPLEDNDSEIANITSIPAIKSVLELCRFLNNLTLTVNARLVNLLRKWSRYTHF